MTRVKLTTMSPTWPWTRHTPGGRGEWGDAKFIIDQRGAGADWWFVFDDLPKEETVEICGGGAVLITPEPPALKKYPDKFVAQFDWIITSDRDLAHPGKIYTQQGLPWHVGRNQQGGKCVSFSKDYDELKSLWPISKTKLISVIASDKKLHPGHRTRFEFVEALKKHFGDRLDVFGWGGREIPDKWDGIAPYKYHIAIENSAQPDYWTEKLGDAYLGGAFPIYYGAPNICDYFPPDGIAIIDVANPNESIERIEKTLLREPNREMLKVCRDLVLERYNLFAVMSDFASKHPARQHHARRTLRPCSAFISPPTLLRRLVGGAFAKLSSGSQAREG